VTVRFEDCTAWRTVKIGDGKRGRSLAVTVGAISCRTATLQVHGLRQKLERDVKRPELIVTVKGGDYKFIASESEG
jgi:hypothetical protein